MGEVTLMPTLRLRFVERDVVGDDGIVRRVRILQQLWSIESYVTRRQEWRDVPIETE